MGLFKNSVGRPSNETIKKRRIIATIMIFSVVLAIGVCVFYTVNYFKNNNEKGVSKNIVATGVEVSMAGNNGGFIMGNKYYAKGVYTSLGTNIAASKAVDTVGSKIVYTASSGKTKLTFKGTFGKDVTKHIGKNYSKLIVQTFNSSNKSISTKSVNIKSGSATVTIAIPKNVYTVKVGVMQVTSNGAKQVFAKTINVSVLPTITPNFVDKAGKNSAGLYVVKNSGANRIKFNLTNPTGRPLYYSVFTYNSHSLKADSVASTATTCASFNKSITTPTYSVKVNTPAAIRLRVYSDLSTCKSDTKAKNAVSTGNSRMVLSENNIKYLPKHLTTNSSKYIVLSAYNKAAIGKNIGSQQPKVCFTYALKYGAYILGNPNYVYNTDKYATYGATDHQSTPKYTIPDSEIYNAIVTNINKGKPVVIRVTSQYSKDHYVTVVGYKYDSSNEVNSMDDIWVIDPYSSYGYGKTGAGVMWEGPAQREETIEKFHTPRRYLTWE